MENKLNIEIKVISLERRIDKREFVERKLKTHYPFEFYNAIDGKNLEMTTEIDNLFKNFTIPKWTDEKSVKAYMISHMNLWEESKKYNKIICILEDDVQPSMNLTIDLNEICKQDFDIYFLTNVMKIGFNSRAYIIKPNGARKLHWYIGNKGFDDPLPQEFSFINSLEFKPIKMKWSENNLFENSDDPFVLKSDIFI